jgi:DNA-binding MarR family transcriptional regulator
MPKARRAKVIEFSSVSPGTGHPAKRKERLVTGRRWLNRQEQRTWRAFLRASRMVEAAVDEDLYRAAGMRAGNYLILAMLSEAPGHELRMTDLATRTNSSRSALSHAVGRLEERGWVRRKACATDRRGQMAILTAAGYRAVVSAAPGHVARVRAAVFNAFTPAEVMAFGQLCERITEAVERELLATAANRDRPVWMRGIM